MPHAQSTATNTSAPVFQNALDMIGNTPILELKNMDFGPCRAFGKMELMNPAGSIKDRIGLSMILAAEADGRLDPSANPKPTIVEGTAGNTGLGLALVASQRGYTLKVVVPDKMSEGKIQHLRAMGAQVILARSDVQKGHPEYYQDVAARIAKETPNSLYINQFSNDDNTAAHYDGTGPEIYTQMTSAPGVGAIDAFIAGVGSGGTISGVGKYLKAQNPNIKIILADPAGSILEPLVNRNETVQAGSWMVEGMGEDFVPDICDLSVVDEAVAVTDKESFIAARELLTKEGILAGSSTGCLIAATQKWCRAQTKPMNVVTLICDQGAKYLSKCFNDFWMIDNGFIDREHTNTLLDLIARRHQEREDYTLKANDPIAQAIKVMGLNSISQLAVLDHTGAIVGIVDESDVLMAVTRDPKNFSAPVSDCMTTRLETIRPEADIADLTPIFRADRVAIVVDAKGDYQGLITKIDLINYLRRQLA